MSKTLADQLRELGQRSILILEAERGDTTELCCDMKECLCPHSDGRGYFEKRPDPPSDWAPSVDHFPRLKKDGGQLVPGMRLSTCTGPTVIASFGPTPLMGSLQGPSTLTGSYGGPAPGDSFIRYRF